MHVAMHGTWYMVMVVARGREACGEPVQLYAIIFIARRRRDHLLVAVGWMRSMDHGTGDGLLDGTSEVLWRW